MEPQVSKFSQARMQRKFTQTVQQQFSAQKECVMNTVTTVQENAGDIYEEAKNINEERAAAAEAAAFADEAAEAEDSTAENEAAEEA